MAVRDGAPEVMTRTAEALLNRAVVKYRAALAIDPQFSDAHNNLANALADLARAEYPRSDNGILREAIGHYEAALRHTRTPDVVHYNFAKALHDLARITDDRVLFKKSMVHFQAAGAAGATRLPISPVEPAPPSPHITAGIIRCWNSPRN